MKIENIDFDFHGNNTRLMNVVAITSASFTRGSNNKGQLGVGDAWGASPVNGPERQPRPIIFVTPLEKLLPLFYS